MVIYIMYIRCICILYVFIHIYVCIYICVYICSHFQVVCYELEEVFVAWVLKKLALFVARLSRNFMRAYTQRNVSPRFSDKKYISCLCFDDFSHDILVGSCNLKGNHWLVHPMPGAFCLHGDPWSTAPLREQPQLVERTLTVPVFPWPSWRIK